MVKLFTCFVEENFIEGEILFIPDLLNCLGLFLNSKTDNAFIPLIVLERYLTLSPTLIVLESLIQLKISREDVKKFCRMRSDLVTLLYAPLTLVYSLFNHFISYCPLVKSLEGENLNRLFFVAKLSFS